MALILLMGCVVLNACGKRGGPFAPDPDTDTFPNQYPKPEQK